MPDHYVRPDGDIDLMTSYKKDYIREYACVCVRAYVRASVRARASVRVRTRAGACVGAGACMCGCMCVRANETICFLKPHYTWFNSCHFVRVQLCII